MQMYDAMIKIQDEYTQECQAGYDAMYDLFIFCAKLRSRGCFDEDGDESSSDEDGDESSSGDERNDIEELYVIAKHALDKYTFAVAGF